MNFLLETAVKGIGFAPRSILPTGPCRQRAWSTIPVPPGVESVQYTVAPPKK
jgi:hypothetical protein